MTDALSVVAKDAARTGDPMLRDAAKILEGIAAALAEHDAKELRDGTKWARRLSPGGRAPTSELVRTLDVLVRKDLDDKRTAVSAAVSMIAAGCAPKQSVDSLTRAIAKRLADATDRDVHDPELRIKAMLRATMTEAEASNAVHGARL